ncbi:hypothetical protein BCIN_02g02860 [Botrytis cinerea B05.10]|uniref:Uncharacterized protein n=1 Tax=Botryotinia fuckeliana (strain B05.10) TaxID=332648 RepID=A0A384J8I5_BOTFB|nr:hypothetical protein BCIN_02g02860 [Botrytis cinerea B05.10]ATZ46945.1 hypothetical protein BCIN_02g02860 [Botrytis cinerea B05.10]
MRHASFGWGTESILRDVSFDIAAGQHVAVTGPVGCGIGYYSQNPWLENVYAHKNVFRGALNDKL